MSETTIRPRPGDLEAACKRHAPVPSGELVTLLGPERCRLALWPSAHAIDKFKRATHE